LTEASLALAALGAGLGIWMLWLSMRAVGTPVSAPARLVTELRLAQLGALVLAVTAGTYVGFAVGHEDQQGAALDLALVGAFFGVAAWAPTRDPRDALTALALAFAAHAVVDVLHRQGAPLPTGAPHWYLLACAIYDSFIAAVCYMPLLRR
jgi:hypothetical protein